MRAQNPKQVDPSRRPGKADLPALVGFDVKVGVIVLTPAQLDSSLFHVLCKYLRQVCATPMSSLSPIMPQQNLKEIYDG